MDADAADRGAASEAEPPPEPAPERDPARGAPSRVRMEILLVLGVSVGQAAVYSAISLAAKLTAGPPLAEQRVTLNAPASPRPNLDLTYQLVGIGFTLVPVALALWLMSGDRTSGSALRRLGLDLRRPRADLAWGAALALLIGLPGLGVYLAGRLVGITAEVVPSALNAYWWTVPVLVLQAVKNSLLEEVVGVGYLIVRLRAATAWPAWAITAASALLRGVYHLYQGWGSFIGNVVMGVLFAEWFRRRGRIAPLVVAHTLLDVVAFLGYHALGDVLP